MRSVNVAELKNHLSTYLRFARNGEEIVIRDRNLPIAKIVPFEGGDVSDEELLLVATGKMRLPKKPLTEAEMNRILQIPTGSVSGRKAIEAVLADREEGW